MFFASYLHSSTSPEIRQKRLHASLKARWIEPRLHYETAQQAQMWLALHRTYSPANSHETESVYHDAFTDLLFHLNSSPLQVISLGCGGGNKDQLLLQLLAQRSLEVHYLPCDINVNLTLEAALSARRVLPQLSCTPVAIDLECAADLKDLLRTRTTSGSQRIFLFFGLLPSLKPSDAQKCLQSLLEPGDLLLASANLSPEGDYATAMRKILPQYDNDATREWLMTFLLELGLPRDVGHIRFEAAPFPSEKALYAILALFTFKKDMEIQVDSRNHAFRAGEILNLFFSIRHTPTLALEFLSRLPIESRRIWTNSAKTEAVLSGIAPHPR